MLRPLDPAERMADRFDRAFTLNFATVARVRGPLTQAQLQHALRCLELRHPLLRTAIVRSAGELSFAPGQAAAIPLIVEDLSHEEAHERIQSSIDHCVWSDEGPRAELSWLRHGEQRSSLILRMHHVVGDGSSGMIAMRDLLDFFTHRELEAVVPLDSPGQESFMPTSHAHTRQQFFETVQTHRPPRPAPALRLSSFDGSPVDARRTQLRRIQLSVAESAALAAHARRDGATVHGVLCGAFAQSVAQEGGSATNLQRVAHPVDLRRHLRELDPNGTPIGDAVGYYVSGITTQHAVDSAQPLGELACAITKAVRAAKAAGEPLMATPLRGPYFVERTQDMSLEAFRDLAEQKIFTDTFALTNLGPLEHLGASQRVGALEVEDLFFVAASSVNNQLGGSAVSFAGRIALQLIGVAPLIPAAMLDRLTERTRARLLAYAGRAG